jgi:ornithine decarboxylase
MKPGKHSCQGFNRITVGAFICARILTKEYWYFYIAAVKCNDSLAVLEVLAALGTGFDCASKGEINKILDLGVSPNRVIFANPAKPSSHIRHAAATGVSTMTFDNETELHKVKSLYPDAKMVIRIRCDATDAQCPLGMKFGCDPISDAPRLLRLARTLDIDVVGVSFHVGSGCREPLVFNRAIASAKDVFDYGITLGYNFELLDIGGGFPGDHGSSISEVSNITVCPLSYILCLHHLAASNESNFCFRSHESLIQHLKITFRMQPCR